MALGQAALHQDHFINCFIGPGPGHHPPSIL